MTLYAGAFNDKDRNCSLCGKPVLRGIACVINASAVKESKISDVYHVTCVEKICGFVRAMK